MTGVIVSNPPLVEQPPGQSSSNPAGLPGVTYIQAVINLAQSWTALQTFLAGTISINGTLITGSVLTSTSPAGGGLTGTYPNPTVASVPASALPALTGDVTASLGVTTLANIPNGVTLSGDILAVNISAPGAPAAGKVFLYTDSTDLRFHDKNASGQIGTTVVPAVAVSHQFVTAISANGGISQAQPAFTDISGSVAASQMPALTGDVTTSAGAVATTIANNVVTNAKAAQMAAVTLKGNPTASLANATDFTIQGLTNLAAPHGTLDFIPIYDHVSGTIKSVTPSSVGAAGSVASIAGNTGAFTLSNGITNSANDLRVNAGHVPGIASNTAAVAGEVGEYITATGGSVALTTGVSVNITSVSLTAGDWQCTGNVYVLPGGTLTQVEGFITTTSATDPARPNNGGQAQWSGTTTAAIGIAVGSIQMLVSGPTTVYLGVFSSFSSTATGAGFIGCRRMR